MLKSLYHHKHDQSPTQKNPYISTTQDNLQKTNKAVYTPNGPKS